MRLIISLLFWVICFNTYSKDQKVLKLDDHQNNFFSCEIDLGNGFGKSSSFTGFYANNGSRVNYYPGSGMTGKFSLNYFNGLRWTYGITYSIRSSGLDKSYENGSGNNTLEIVTPTIRYAPMLFHKNTCKLNIGVGWDAVVANWLEVQAKLSPDVTMVYDFKKSFNPTVLVEYQAAFSRHVGMRFGVSGHQFKYELASFKFNNEHYDISYLPNEMTRHSVFVTDAYIGIFVFL